jgi:hypothetical protein
MLDWSKRVADEQFLLDSGLLFDINRQMLHPIGLSLVVVKQTDGTLRLKLKDSREKPEAFFYKKEEYETAYWKYKKFMKDYGYKQWRKREEKLGWGLQTWQP